jgi:hypothetical protein
MGLSALIALAPLGAAAADLSQVGPQATAAQIVAAHGSAQEPALKLVFTVEDNVSPPHPMTVESAPGFLYIEESGHGTLYDYRIRRVIGLDSARHVFTNSSLYALVDFYAAETASRRFERGALGAMKAPDQAILMDPFWVQSELRIVDPDDPPASIDQSKTASGAFYFSSHDKPAASYVLSSKPLADGDKPGFARLLRMRAAIHPRIADTLVASGMLPQRLSFIMPPVMKKPDVTWTLQSADHVTADYPLTADYSAEPLPSDSKDATVQSLRALLPVMLAATSGSAGHGPRSVADYQAAIDGALRARKPFQAVLLSLELTLQYGAQADCAAAARFVCHSSKEVFAAAAKDRRTQDLKRSLQSPPAQLDSAIKLLRGLKRDDVSNGYVVDDFLANDLVAAGHGDQALPLFLGAIKGNPYLGGYYKDLGDLFRRSFQPDLAWLCYDLGRALPGGAGAPVISDMNGFEQKLAEKYPEFF